jgi:2,3-bisphosphoglycerate-independent phosphoglycerate mutase
MKPQMSAPQVGENVQKAMREGYDFVVVNFANGDMVGHTGDFEAAKMAVEAVDHELGKLIKVAKEEGYAMVITSDHGNCEEMATKEGDRLTNHTTYDVYCFVMAEGVSKVKEGALNNIAPTVLKLMDIDAPDEMSKALV